MESFLILLFFLTFNKINNENCSNYDNIYNCEGNSTTFNEDMDDSAFQTPPRNDIYGRYKSTYQDMHYLMGYAQLKYSLDKKSCTIKFITKINPKLGTKGIDYEIYYSFGENEIQEDTMTFNSVDHSYKNGMPISAKIIDKKTGNEIVKLELEDEYFLWDNPEIVQIEEFKNGQKGSIVEFFGWPYEDIAEECEFLSKAGYLGLKIYSPNEHLLTKEHIESGVLNPWWYGTQTVSFKLHSRAGNKKDLKDLINKCRSFNIRVYAEVVINHMTGNGNDMYENHIKGNTNDECKHWGAKSGSDGSPFWTVGGRNSKNPITQKMPVVEYPSVPYFPSDFHCISRITNTKDVKQLTNGWLSGLADVNTEKDYVQQRIADFFTELISIGISGISIPNGRHIKPESFTAILSKLKANLGGVFPDDFFIVIILENIDMDIVMCDEESGLNFGTYFTQLLNEAGFVEDEIYKIKIWLKGWMEGESNFPICDDQWMIAEKRHVISLEYSDDINMGNTYITYIRDRNIEEHRSKTISMFSNDYNWEIIFIFSTFSLYKNIAGIPDGKSDCSFCETEKCHSDCTKNVPYRKAYNPLSTGYDTGDLNNWIEGEYTRIHRDILIVNAMRDWLGKPQLTEEQLYGEERLKVNCNEKCLICNDESKKDDLCLSCNRNKGYYPILYPGKKQKYYECYNSSLKYDRLYFDSKENAFKPCYETCKECEKGGDSENHNCLSCDTNLMPKPNYSPIPYTNSNTFNCVIICTNSYYFTSFGQYKCTEFPFCPAEASIFIKEKNKCIDSCQNDADYKFLYNGNCVKECPKNTIEQNNICQNKNTEECTLIAKEIELDNFYNNDLINSIVKSYRNEYSYTEKHALRLVNEGYSILVFKNFDCLNMYSLEIINIDQNSCINKIKSQKKIDENLIIVYFEKKETIRIKNAGYLIYNPITAQKLEFENICKDEVIKKIEINENEYFEYINLEVNIGDDEPKECPEGLYPVVNVDKTISFQDCKDKNILHEKLYFNYIEGVFMPCYPLCKTCNREGNEDNNNCLSCDPGYIRHPLSTGTLFNCVQKCQYSYYLTTDNIYKCTTNYQCPLDYNKYIKEKNQCIDDCKKDDIYRFLYNGLCLKNCPNSTNSNILNEGDDYLCKEQDFNKCTLSLKEVRLTNFYDDGGLGSLVKSYNDEFFYTNKHISEFKNTYFKIIIYKDQSCLTEYNLKYPLVIFGECYTKVKNTNKIKEDLIIVLLEKYNINGPSTTSYSLYNPLDGKKLDAESICKDEDIVVQESVFNILKDYKINSDLLKPLLEQNINIFDKEDAFYTDICYSFDSPTGRDITLEDRLKTFYPNVSLCDIGCLNKGVNLSTMIAICTCKFNDISNNDFVENFGEISGAGEIFEIVSHTNLEVLRCIKYIFRQFKSIGIYIIIISLAICIGMTLLFFLRDLNLIRKYIINKTTKYLNYLSNSPNPEKIKVELLGKDLSKNINLNDIKS